VKICSLKGNLDLLIAIIILYLEQKLVDRHFLQKQLFHKLLISVTDFLDINIQIEIQILTFN